MEAATVDTTKAVEKYYRPKAVWNEILCISQSKGYELLASGRLRSVLIDGARRIPESALVEFQASLTGGELTPQ